MKNIIKKILKEQVNDKVITKVLSQMEKGVIKPPYFKYLDLIGLTEDEIKYILEKFIGGEMTETNPVNIVNDSGDEMYLEFNDGSWAIRQYDENGRLTYMKDSSNYWYKKGYDKNGNMISFDNSEGFYMRREYDDQNNILNQKESITH
jgi:hypothetical protein